MLNGLNANSNAFILPTIPSLNLRMKSPGLSLHCFCKIVIFTIRIQFSAIAFVDVT